jgi:hypothetical protein
LVVVTAGRGSDAAWRARQADQAGLSERGGLVVAEQAGHVVAEQAGHVVAVDQPQIVIEAIRAVVGAARGGNDGGPCAGPFARKDTARPD